MADETHAPSRRRRAWPRLFGDAADIYRRSARCGWLPPPTPARRPRKRLRRGILPQRPMTRSRSSAPIPAVDAVYVATPHQFHAQHATLAAEARQASADRKTDGADARRLRGHRRGRPARRRACRRRPQPLLRCAGAAPAHAHRERRVRRGAHDQRAELHRLSVPPAPPRRARHSERRRRDLQSGGASGRHGAPGRRRARDRRARGDRHRGTQRDRPKAPMRRFLHSRMAPSPRSPTAATAISIQTNSQGWIGEMGQTKTPYAGAVAPAFQDAGRGDGI